MPLKRAFFNKFACKLKIRNTFLIKLVHVGLHDVANAAKIKTTENTFTLFNYFSCTSILERRKKTKFTANPAY